MMMNRHAGVSENKDLPYNKIIESVIKSTFESLSAYPNQKVSNEENFLIVYPHSHKDNGQLDKPRVSEQELKQTFIYFLQEEGLYYSVETPTKWKYRFTGETKDDKNVPRKCVSEGDKGRSANIDLSVYEVLTKDEAAELVAHVEFKSGNPEPKDIEKDLLKLCVEPVKYGYFLLIVKSSDDEIWKNLTQKINDSFANIIKREKFEDKTKYISIYVCSLNDTPSGSKRYAYWNPENKSFVMDCF